MDAWLLTHASGVRLGAFFGIFALMAALEIAAPRRVLQESKLIRWTSNLAITVINSALLRILYPVAAVDVRTVQEFVGPLGHIAEARNLPLAELRDKIEELAPARMWPVVVCRTEKCSLQAARVLGKAGFGDVLILRGGMEQWNREDYAVEWSCDGDRSIPMKEMPR